MKELILIVADHEELRKSLLDWLGVTFPDCSFLEASGGEDAVALASTQEPDIVLMNVQLPDMCGIEATRRIKAAVPRAQVVVLATHDTDEYRRDAAAAGTCAYVLKSKMSTELIPIMTELLSR